MENLIFVYSFDEFKPNTIHTGLEICTDEGVKDYPKQKLLIIRDATFDEYKTYCESLGLKPEWIYNQVGMKYYAAQTD